ncbi:MAG: TetR/AcrR family transcriptional regulator [Panacagrimonas sp.]
MPATPRGEATRRKLMAAAEAEFGAKGFHIASVSSITTRAGVGQGTFYLYFRTKDEIFVTLVREIGRALRRHMRDAVTDAVDRIDSERLAFEAFFEFASLHPGLYRIVQEAQFVDDGVFREYYERIAASYTADLDGASQRGEITPGCAETRAWALMGIAHFLGMKHSLWGGKVPGPDKINCLMDLVANGLAPRS